MDKENSRFHQPTTASRPWNTNTNTNNITTKRISVTPGAIPPALSRTNFSSKQQQQQRRSFGSTSLVPLSYSISNSSSLPAPTVVYSDNHLLAINKPAGWHSVPNISKKRGRNNPTKNGNSNVNSNNENNNRGAEHTHTTTTNISSSLNKKCLLTHLQTKGLGGGSNKDFLLPLHRIDQPCTGILLFGKTSKAASRITTVWKGKKKKKKKNKNNKKTQQQTVVRDGVVKDYLCVVPTSRIAAMEEVSVPVSLERDDIDTYDNNEMTLWNRLDGLMLRQSATSSASELHGVRTGTHLRWQQQKYYNERRRKGKSVRIIRPGRKKTIGENEPHKQKHGDDDDKFYDYDHEVDNSMMRPVSVRWKIVGVPNIEPGYTLLLVRTSEGARHMVRALLAQVGDCPIIGDLRYWTAPKRMNINSSNLPPSDRYSDGVHDDQAATARGIKSFPTAPNEKDPLKDRSVALHAYGVYFDPQQLQLGTLDTFEFRAPVPSTWKSFFGIDNAEINNIL
mmetsp:Transcript_17751/g.37107  ORF Transcript_17751/g.37107 Transcript_17751/m.37107 type:complete len:506 (-) Transcript_17751:414-1931(-)